MRFIFSYSAIAYFPLPILGASELRNPHLANACKLDLFVSSDESRLLIPSRWPPYLISAVSSYTPAKRIFGSGFNISLESFIIHSCGIVVKHDCNKLVYVHVFLPD